MKKYRVIINGDEYQSIDPVVKVVIYNGYASYEYYMEDLKTIKFEEIKLEETK
jgi:hypothetical protein